MAQPPRTTESVPLNVAFFLSFGIGKEGKPSGTDPLLLLLLFPLPYALHVPDGWDVGHV